MTDRELLELAAKAAGMKDMRYASPYVGMVKMLDPTRPETCGSIGPDWNPLTDDGDCARLEAALSISITWWEQRVFAVATVANGGLAEVEKYADHAGDKQKARRHAVTRLAAEIGRSMK